MTLSSWRKRKHVLRVGAVLVGLGLLGWGAKAWWESSPRTAAAFVKRGNEYSAKDQHDQAIADFTQAIQLDPKNAEAYCYRGMQYSRKEEYDKAIADYSKTVDLDPRYRYAYKFRGGDYYRRKEYEKAIADFTTVIELDDTDSPAYCMRGLAYADLGDYDKAIADFTVVIGRRPEAVDYRCRGLMYEATKAYEKAVADYTKAVELNPENAEIHNSLALLLAGCPDDGVRNGKMAVSHARTACDLSDWKDESHLATLAAAHAECGDFKEAVKWQKRAIEVLVDKKAPTETAREWVRWYEEKRRFRVR
jgi:tetratricopeptide (TPR) repeat protein